MMNAVSEKITNSFPHTSRVIMLDHPQSMTMLQNTTSLLICRISMKKDENTGKRYAVYYIAPAKESK